MTDNEQNPRLGTGAVVVTILSAEDWGALVMALDLQQAGLERDGFQRTAQKLADLSATVRAQSATSSANEGAAPATAWHPELLADAARIVGDTAMHWVHYLNGVALEAHHRARDTRTEVHMADAARADSVARRAQRNAAIRRANRGTTS
jgi:hypothetical protein